MIPRQADLVIVGGGAIGTAIALEAVRAGREVLLLERRAAVGDGASGGTACLIPPSHAESIANIHTLREGLGFLRDPASPFALAPSPRLVPWLLRFTRAAIDREGEHARTALIRRMSVAGLELHRQWHDEFETGLVQLGVLNAFETAAAFQAMSATLPTLERAGIRSEVLDAGQTREAEPLLTRAAGGVMFPDEAHVDSRRFVERVAAHAIAKGARVETGVETVRVTPGKESVRVYTSAGELDAQTVVIAAGVGSRTLAGDLGLKLPLVGAKGYHVEVSDLARSLRRPVFLAETRVVATPLEGRLRLAGTLELGTDPDGINRRRLDAVRRAGDEWLGGVAEGRTSAVWRGLRPCLPDGMPAIGRSASSDRLIVATGHAMLGIMLAPWTAVRVGEILRGDELDPEYDALRPDRFGIFDQSSRA